MMNPSLMKEILVHLQFGLLWHKVVKLKLNHSELFISSIRNPEKHLLSPSDKLLTEQFGDDADGIYITVDTELYQAAQNRTVSTVKWVARPTLRQ